MKDANAQQEDVTGLFRKFGGDAGAYKEFAPAEIPAATRPVAPPVAPAPSPAPALHVLAPTPAAPVQPPVAARAVEPLPVAA
ncbi:MAG TPA: BcsR/BcsP family cellulose biosynthesis protein, partial [Hyphomicrobiaceae bacterium]|nr:BcsR/BcsP family cellulose biosynthesis protein [Hyphomicrobiaceae bacterium]